MKPKWSSTMAAGVGVGLEVATDVALPQAVTMTRPISKGITPFVRTLMTAQRASCRGVTNWVSRLRAEGRATARSRRGP